MKMTEQELNEKRLAFVDDTVAAYSPDPDRLRSVNAFGECMYAPAHPESLGCAIGRLMTEEQRAEVVNGMTIRQLCSKHPKLVPKELRGLGVDFLQKVQSLHDITRNWGEVGLSDLGRDCVKEIKRRFNLTEVV